MTAWIIAAIVVVAIVAIVLVLYFEFKLPQIWHYIAARHGLRHRRGDPLALASQYPFAFFKGGGDHVRVKNTLDGHVSGMSVILFEIEYHIGKDDEQHAHTHSALMVETPLCSPHLVIRPETAFDRVDDLLGLHDINFEYDRFNRAFRVTCDDKKYAYDICTPAMMELMLETPELCWELLLNKMLLYSNKTKTLNLNETGRFLGLARRFLQLLPGYLRQT